MLRVCGCVCGCVCGSAQGRGEVRPEAVDVCVQRLGERAVLQDQVHHRVQVSDQQQVFFRRGRVALTLLAATATATVTVVLLDLLLLMLRRSCLQLQHVVQHVRHLFRRRQVALRRV